MDRGAWWAAVRGVTKSRTRLSDFTFTFHFHALEKEMATHSSIPAWRIPGTGEPGGLASMGLHRVGHDWSDLAAEGALQIAEKRREAKGKGEKERYIHLNSEFQRLERRDKKAFLSDQCKEIEENNRMGKTRDLFKKIWDTKGTFHAKMGSIKDRNGMNLTEAEDINNSGKNTQKIFIIRIQKRSSRPG